jgi:hypothetical protein
VSKFWIGKWDPEFQEKSEGEGVPEIQEGRATGLNFRTG